MNSPKNLPASVHDRLLNRAKTEKRPFGELLQYYAMERFLYRLSRSRHVDRFILKGALMLRAWQLPELRPTMDIDMLGRTSNLEADIVEQIRDILVTEVEPDIHLRHRPDYFILVETIRGIIIIYCYTNYLIVSYLDCSLCNRPTRVIISKDMKRYLDNAKNTFYYKYIIISKY